jgi:hypothetical protein
MSIEGIVQDVRAEITRLQQVLELLGSGNHKPAKVRVKRAKRHMSAAGRKRIAAAQRARWAKVRAAKK